MKTNLHYFEISKNNPEQLLDDAYVFDERHPDLDKYIQNAKEIKSILITIRTLVKSNGKREVIDRYFGQLSKIIGKHSNCSEFACFVNACDNIIADAKNEIGLLEKIAEKYFAKRILNEAVPEEWVQALIDKNSSSKKGKSGEKKLVKILEKLGFEEVFDWNDFKIKKCVVMKFSKRINLKSVRKNLGIKIKTKKQNKTLDLIIKAQNKIFICEAKHLNTSGGAQDKQISELIEIIGLKEKSGISYVAFFDGKYSNIFLGGSGGGDKITAQRKELAKCLRANPQNYWMNTSGFEALFLDLAESANSNAISK